MRGGMLRLIGHVFVSAVLLTACGAPPSAPPAQLPSNPPTTVADSGTTDAGVDAGAQPAHDAGQSVPPMRFVPDGGRLCDIPPDYVANGGDPTFIDCAVEVDHLVTPPTTAPTQLKIVAWNVEFAKAYSDVLSELRTRPQLANADVLLLSEVARDSLVSNPQRINQARELARALNLNYAFAVEWDRRELPNELGEHGVAVLSKFPMTNLTQIRHTPLNDWYQNERLYGGRVTLGVDLTVGARIVRVYASHLCTRGTGDSGRAVQGAEIRLDAMKTGRPAIQVVGGDLNTYTCNPNVYDCTVAPRAEKVVQEFLSSGWNDGTSGWNGVTQMGAGFFPQRLDWTFFRGTTATPGTGVTANGSDHYPVVFTLNL